MNIADGSYIAANKGELMVGHVDDPFSLWSASPGLIILIAELARGTAPHDLFSTLSPVMDVDKEVIDKVVELLNKANILVDAPTSALRDPHLEVPKILSAAPDLARDEPFWAATRECRSLTLTSAASQYALWSAIHHVVRAGIPGDIVECGVWRGGSMRLAALALLAQKNKDRRLRLFDTFDWSWDASSEQDRFLGMPSVIPGRAAADEMAPGTSVADVRNAVTETGYPDHLVHCIPGYVEETIPSQAPDVIALLRLDTDQYESTYHELTHLYPRVTPGGVIIIDDYGKLSGATQATDEYLDTLHEPVLMHRIDTQGRMFTKPKESR